MTPLEAARASSEAVTPGGLHGDPATLSGVTRKPNLKAQARRFAAYDAEAKAALAEEAAVKAAVLVAAKAKRLAADAAAHCDLASLTPGDAVRTRHGWHRVVRTNALSVSVATAYSWTDVVRHEQIIETRAAEAVKS